MNNEVTSAHDERLGLRSWLPQRKTLLAVVLVGLMIASGLAIVVPGVLPAGQVAKAADPVKADIQAMGPREVTTTYSNMFEMYMKSTSMSGDWRTLGHDNTTMGMNPWWVSRHAYYPDLIVRGKYPFTIVYDYYSANIATSITTARMGYGVYSFYRISVDARNLTTAATGTNLDPQILPVLGSASLDGGSPSFNWYMNYLTEAECTAINGGTHYANAYYGVPAGAIVFGGTNYYDGWWNELSGIVTLDKNAAKKFLGLAGSSDLRTDFNTSNAGNALGVAWAAHWRTDGSALGTFNIYATYDYDINSGTNVIYLKLDPTSTATKLVVRIWGISWGYELLMERFLEGKLGIMKYNLAYPEDFYLNGTLSPQGGNITVRYTGIYDMIAWKDPNVWEPVWKLETQHTDACPNVAKQPASSWASRYNGYDVVSRVREPLRAEWSPGTINFGGNVMYWQPPRGMVLAAGEKLVIKLPTGPAVGYQPYKGTSDLIDAAKVTEMISKTVWGELVLGTTPATIASGYNAATKTLTLTSSTVIPAPPANPTYPSLNLSGSPCFYLVVSKVSTYKLEMVEPGPFLKDHSYTLRVTAQNYSGQTTTDWNGTVDLPAVAGVSYVASSHTYVVGDHGVWTVGVTFTSAGDKVLVAKDHLFGADIDGTSTVTVTNPSVGYGQLRVATNPACPSMISIDGQWASRWGLDWVKLTPGTHTLSFGDVVGMTKPAPTTITIVDGEVTTYTAQFTAMGSLRVITNPAMPSTVYVDGVPRNDWGFWNYVPAGTYTVSFGLVAGFNVPSPQTVTVAAGGYAEVTGNFVANPSAPGPDPASYGMLRVTTNPAVPTMVTLDGHWMSHWGLNWVKLVPGTYTLSFTDVQNAITPAPRTVTITAGQTTTVDAVFNLAGVLRVMTSPAMPSTIYVDGIPRNDWGIWTDVAPGTYVVSFGAVAGFVTPAPQTVTVVASGYTEVTGVFVAG